MNKLNIASTGYPGTTESWKFLSEMNSDLSNIIGKLINNNAQSVLVPGRKVIITGLTVAHNQISDGYISVNGEVYRFYGGPASDAIVLIEEVTEVGYNTDPANSGQLHSLPTYYKRYAKPGNPGEGFQDIALSDFVRLDALIDISERTKQATESRKGIAEIATQREVNVGVDNTKIVTAKKLKNSIIKGALNFGNTGSEFTINLPAVIQNADYTVSGSIIPGDSDKRALFYVITEKKPGNFKVQFFLADHIDVGVTFNNDSIFEYIVVRN